MNIQTGKTSILAGAAAVLALTGVTLLVAPPAEPDRQSRTDTATTPAPSASASAGSDAATDSSTATPPPAAQTDTAGPDTVLTPEQNQQRRVVTAFARAFTAKGPQQRWLSSLRPYVTPELLEGLRYTDPRQRATGTLAGVTATVQAGQFLVDYRGGQPLNVTVTRHGTSWQVDAVTPVPPPPAPSGTDL